MLKENNQIKTTPKPRKGLPLLNEVEIIYSGPKLTEAVKVKCSSDSYPVLRKAFDPRKLDYKEIFVVLLLNRAGYCLGISKIGEGATSGVVVNTKEIFQLALKANASGIILAHNHPSGQLKASEQDLAITKKVKAGAELLDMNLLDHIIITSSSYYSLADEGLM